MVAADDFVRQPRAKQWHEIIGKDKGVDDFRGGIGILAQSALEHRAGDVPGENASHAVVAEAFARLVPDNEFDLARPAAFNIFFFRR